MVTDRVTVRLNVLTKRVTTLSTGQHRLWIELRKLGRSHVALGLSHRELVLSHRELALSHRDLTASHQRLLIRVEQLETTVKLLTERVVAIGEAMERSFAMTTVRFDRLESMMMTFIRTQGGLNREHRETFRDHDARLRVLETERGASPAKH
jgi:hypothetical protein